MTIESLGLLGGGNMGEALLRGALSALPNLSIGVLERNGDRAHYLHQHYPDIKKIDTAKELSKYDAIIIAVKPQQFEEATLGLSQAISRPSLIISVAAGITLSIIQKQFSTSSCVRVMPNTPALIGKGMTGISFGGTCSKEQQLFVKTLFSSIGLVSLVPETLINAVTAVSGSGPAYFYHLIDVMANQATGIGLSYAEASTLLTQTMLGSALMIQQSGKSPAELIRQVTSPGGTTEAAMKTLIASNLSAIWGEALQSAFDRSKELSLS